jgi:hypothetical protein
MKSDPNSSRPTISRGKKWLFSIILLVTGLVVLEALSHAYLRVAAGYAGGEFLQQQFDPYKNIHPTVDWTDTRGVRHNAQGFRRSEDVQRAKPDGTFRVFLMGASTAYGTGGLWPHLQRDFEVIDNSETIDAYLEEMLSEALPYDRVEVINAAIPSIWTHHHLIYLNQTILRYEPDLVLFLDGLNDHFHYYEAHDQFASYAYQEQSHVIMGPPTIASLLRMNGWWLFRTSAFAHVSIRAGQTLKLLISGRAGDSTPILVDEAIDDLAGVFRQNALKMIERNALILRNEGVRALFMLQPMLILERENLDRMPDIEREMFEFNIRATQPNYEEYIRRATPIIASMVEETVEPLGAEFLDLTAIFPSSEGQIFTDYAHLTPEGNRILATHVARKILEREGGWSTDLGSGS